MFHAPVKKISREGGIVFDEQAKTLKKEAYKDKLAEAYHFCNLNDLDE